MVKISRLLPILLIISCFCMAKPPHKQDGITYKPVNNVIVKEPGLCIIIDIMIKLDSLNGIYSPTDNIGILIQEDSTISFDFIHYSLYVSSFHYNLFSYRGHKVLVEYLTSKSYYALDKILFIQKGSKTIIPFWENPFYYSVSTPDLPSALTYKLVPWQSGQEKFKYRFKLIDRFNRKTYMDDE